MFFRSRTKLNLALEGGGAHGAFTWGVLDRLLEDNTFDIGWISATSAGAVNAVAMASGLAAGGPDGARARLRAVWEAVAKAGVPELIRRNPMLAGFARSNAMAQMASMFSPYDFNPLGFDPFRKLLETEIDFDLIRTHAGPELLIAATDVATGRPRFFRRKELTVQCVLASACLPTIHHAVTIDGAAYWDGGFSANPDLVTLGRESPVPDTLIVKLTSMDRGGVPTTTREISGRINHITFYQPMIRDVEMIVATRALYSRWSSGATVHDKRLARHRFHLIEAGRFTSTLAPETKAKPEMEMLTYLFNAGRSETEKWLARAKPHVGKRDTVDLARTFLSPRPAPLNAEGTEPAPEAPV